MRQGGWLINCAVANEGVKAPVVILACGNPSRGDDALGPLLLEHLEAWLAAEGLSNGFELIGDFQLNIEHALDLAGRRLALFIDAPGAVPLQPIRSALPSRSMASGQKVRKRTSADWVEPLAHWVAPVP